MHYTLTILIPMYNEERTIVEVYRAIIRSCPDAEILCIDDGSTDGSTDVLASALRKTDRLITIPHAGKGAAIRAGLREANGEYIVIQDADLEYNPGEIPLLLQEAVAHPGCAVFGSRFLCPNPNIYKRYLLGNKVLTQWMNMLFGAKISDSYTCYKLLPTTLFRELNITATGFELEAEICAKCLSKGVDIREVPVHYKPRTIAEGKKIGWKDACKGIWTTLRIRWFSR
jgi:glycosyltransferase involved in cell wall biosynthesis